MAETATARHITVIGTERLPIKFWGTPEELIGFDEALQQAKNLANHPLARRWICLMPDVHVGYGMPIGGVLATQGGVIPNAVGVDIGCGMIAARLALEAAQLTTAQLSALRQGVHQRVPVGTAHHRDLHPLPALLRDELDEVAAAGGTITVREAERVQYQLGTLGSGNHFIELQADQHGAAWIMLHSGSRNVGKRVCDYYHGIAKRLMEQFHSRVPDPDLAFLPEGLPEFDRYLAEMHWCMHFAEASRAAMLAATLAALAEVLGRPVAIEEQIETHHNFAAYEHHFGMEALVHRKGAVKAEGLVTIPGSMGTASYICRGLSPRESFNTCSHGAGRVLGRRQANRAISHEQAVAAMQQVVYEVRAGDYDEMPMAYKDIDRVIAAQSDLVTPVYRLRPLTVVKG